ncbi:hypothetical protein D3C79_1096590 [compost metagenome]
MEILEQEIVALAARQSGVLEGNGRWARNVVDKVRMAQNNRLARTGNSDLMTIEAEDIQSALNQM